MVKNGLIIALIGILFVLQAKGQGQTWSQRLTSAERDYDEGRLTGIPQRLAGGLDTKFKDGGFSKEERIRALKLITLVHIFTDNEPEAEEFLVRLLRADKEHNLNPLEDPSEMYFLHAKFRSKPIFRLALKIGVNKSYPRVIKSFNTSSEGSFSKIYNGNGTPPGSANQNGTLGISNWVELMAERHLAYGIEVGTGVNFRGSKYDVDNYVGFNQDGEPSLVSYLSNQQYFLRTPLYLRYNVGYLKNKQIIPYFTLGASYDYLWNAVYVEATRTGGTSFTLNVNNNLKDLNQTKNHNMSAFLAVGTKLKIKTHFLTFEMRYDKGLFNYINPERRFDGNQFITYELAFVEDDIALDVLSFSIGYTYSVYSPKKLKEFR